MNDSGVVEAILNHQQQLRACSACPQMIGPVIVGQPATGPILSVGQAPGIREGDLGRPFAWTAGKTLFKWFRSIGVDEATYRAGVYMAAVCRCFPGRTGKGGDRVPDRGEIERCSGWLDREFELLRPTLVLPIGRLAIGRFIDYRRLDEVVGRQFAIEREHGPLTVIPLPHPSGLNTWIHSATGRQQLAAALDLIAARPEWRALAERSTATDPGLLAESDD